MKQSNQITKPEDRFFVAGVNYRTAPVEVRERMAVAHQDRLEVSRLLQLKAGLAEVVVLWTCNRVEIYGAVRGDTAPDIERLFGCLNREAPSLYEHIYCSQGQSALRHLFRVASSLDSMVMGETQITGQVKDAYEAARQAGLTGKVLNTAFQTALRTAKAVRTETAIGRGARSVGGVAVAHAREVLGSRQLKEHTVLMVGAGEMAACCLRHLQKKGNCRVLVANRSRERAETLAKEFSGTAVPLAEMYQAMAEADVVISSTGSPDTVINHKELAPVMKHRSDRPLVLIDIAVPRDIDPAVVGIEGVHLHDIDALQSSVQQTMDQWEKDLDKCAQIIECEIDEVCAKLTKKQVDRSRSKDGVMAAVAV